MRLAREALSMDSAPGATALRVTINRRRKVVRLSFLGPFSQGRPGAHWYAAHHALARLLSAAANATVHAYVYDADEGEEVIAYGNGRRVGGEKVVYEDAELPCPLDELDDEAFGRLQSRWPMGHLAYVFGLTRDELLRIPHAPLARVLPLEGTHGGTEAEAMAALEALLLGPALPRAVTDAG
ncbi:hypothetical protein [Corallococcus sp. CA053C]|uniref:hypothetical protein n=1 Tax=Corallococcus sp. CA053C TaxID=2316732 RepID=UPI001F3ACE1B|nr:hypothetical protein [Corallococcus sp. CA053C]